MSDEQLDEIGYPILPLGGEETVNLVRLRLITHSARLVDARKERGMTQPDIALAIGIHLYRISGIETLKVIPTAEEMVKFARVLEKPIDYLFPVELLSAVEAGVFLRRKAELTAPQVISLTEAYQLQLAYDGEDEMVKSVDRKLLAERVSEVLETLKPRERWVLQLRFGLKDGRSRTLEEVGREFNVTRERIRQIEGKALRLLRHPARSRKLKDFW